MRCDDHHVFTLAPPRDRGCNRAVAAWRKAKAVELAVEGHTCDAIARKVGYANRGTAYRVVRQALDERIADNVDELRATEVARLDAPVTSRPSGRSPRGSRNERGWSGCTRPASRSPRSLCVR